MKQHEFKPGDQVQISFKGEVKHAYKNCGGYYTLENEGLHWRVPASACKPAVDEPDWKGMLKRMIDDNPTTPLCEVDGKGVHLCMDVDHEYSIVYGDKVIIKQVDYWEAIHAAEALCKGDRDERNYGR